MDTSSCNDLLGIRSTARESSRLHTSTYSRLLISSLPEVGVRYDEKRLAGIPGTPPGLLTPPVGCRFRDRCPPASEKCVEQPPFVEVEPGHFVACWKES